MTAYYNEIDPFAAQWLRELIKVNAIAPGVVDERSIEDVKPAELRGFTQCHFFAGIGAWSHALREAGWNDDHPVWTGSCPCQPFSAAGKGGGFDDERHLWPSFAWLIEQCSPAVVFGEQVASKAAGPWFDLVQTDVERMGYAFGLVPFPSAGVGAPHIRDRAYWVADSECAGLQRGEWRRTAGEEGASSGHRSERGGTGGMGDTNGQPAGRDSRGAHSAQNKINGADSCHRDGFGDAGSVLHQNRNPGPTNGFWRDADWLGCRDGKFRPVEPGTFPLANGAAARVGRLRGYGNAINAEAAKAFIESFMELT